MSKLSEIFIILLAFALIHVNSKAQTHSFDKILTESGEENLSVRQIIQDKNGFLWLATFSGLYRYEGDDFIIKHRFNNNIEINSDVTSLVQDTDSTIWIGTDHGLSKYNPVSEEIITYFHDEKDSLSIRNDKIRCVDIDKYGRIWVGTKDGGLNLYSPADDGFIKIKLDSSVYGSPAYIRTILCGSDGQIWIGTLRNGVYCFSYSDNEIDSVCNYRTEDSMYNLSNNHVYCLFEDVDGKIVVGTRNGINVFHPETKMMQEFNLSPDILTSEMTNYFRSFERDKNGKLWIGTWGGLILCDNFSDIETGNFELLLHDRKTNHSISHDQIMDIFQDKSGIVWIGTENGLNNYDPYQNQFKQIHGDAFDQLKEQSLTAFCSYEDGILIASLSHGILFKNKNGTHFIPPNNQFQDFGVKIYSLLVDSKNNIWAGTYNGVLIRMDGRDHSFSTYKHSENTIPIYSLAELDNGNIIVGTSGEGLKYLNPKTNKFIEENGLPGTLINDVHIDKNKNLWAATEFGIFKRSAESTDFDYFLPDESELILSPNIFNDVAESEEGELFVGGRNGLYKYEPSSNTFISINFNNAEQLWVTNIQFDSDQNLWLNLNFNQIAKWEQGSDQLRFFKVNNGIRSSQYNRRGFYMDKNDELYLSGFDKIYQFNTSAPLKNTYSPVPVFTSLIINNSKVHVGTVLNKQIILKKNINYQEEILLSHLNKDFTIEFASTSYLNSSDNKYKYMLHGYDQEWQVGNQRQAHYTNLSPGKYTFEVFSANNDNHWSIESAKLMFRVKPSPFLSVWAIVLYIIGMTLLLYQIRRYVLARLHLKRELLIERVKRDKEEKFHEERLRFYTNISHELRTPLTLIMGPAKELVSADKPHSDNSRLHQLILTNSQRLLSLVNQLLDFRKSLHQGMKLKVTPTNLIEIIESNMEAFAYMAAEKHIQISFATAERSLKGWFDIDKIDIILFNILSNAFKYTPYYGLITLRLNILEANTNLQTQHIQLEISNTGKGIPKKMQEKVFERFYQISDTTTTNEINTGTGIGLALVKNMVDLHHGKIKLESVTGKSTTFTLFLPIHRENYSDEEIFDFTRDADRRTKELIKTVDAGNNDAIFEKQDAERKQILIVEDNQELRDYLARFLSKEYKIYTAADGVEGLERCKANNPDLIISDVMMDNMDGLQFCKEVKSTPEISHIPVVLMTALASVENKLEGYKIGADEYISKPFEPDLLQIRVKSILDNVDRRRAEFRRNQELGSKELTISKIDEDFLNKVIDLVNENLDNAAFDIESFCKNLGVSSSQLYRKIKSITGLSPNEFIRAFRLKKAAKMISETNFTMSEIAYKVGFNDALYFSKCFKKQFGSSPSKYLQSL